MTPDRLLSAADPAMSRDERRESAHARPCPGRVDEPLSAADAAMYRRKGRSARQA